MYIDPWFQFQYHWYLIPGVQLAISQHWSKLTASNRWQVLWTNDNLVYWRVYLRHSVSVSLSVHLIESLITRSRLSMVGRDSEVLSQHGVNTPLVHVHFGAMTTTSGKPAPAFSMLRYFFLVQRTCIPRKSQHECIQKSCRFYLFTPTPRVCVCDGWVHVGFRPNEASSLCQKLDLSADFSESV